MRIGLYLRDKAEYRIEGETTDKATQIVCNEPRYLRRQLFSFDLPPELFNLYAEDGRLTESRALDLKSDMLSSFHAIVNVEGLTRLITFELDRDWITRVRRRIRGLPRRSEAEFQAEEDRT